MSIVVYRDSAGRMQHLDGPSASPVLLQHSPCESILEMRRTRADGRTGPARTDQSKILSVPGEDTRGAVIGEIPACDWTQSRVAFACRIWIPACDWISPTAPACRICQCLACRTCQCTCVPSLHRPNQFALACLV